MCYVYSLQYCPNCDELKKSLMERGIEYKEKLLDDIDVITDLLFDGVVVTEAPILHYNDTYYQPSDLFSGGSLHLPL